MTSSRLLEVDSVGNVLLGLPLLLAPEFVSEFLGLPMDGAAFYPAILGAVFVGIGVALLLERFRPSAGGLGLGGAMSINLIFGVVLAGWLVLSGADLRPRGVFLLSVLAVILVGISMVEAFSLSRDKSA